MKTASRLSIYEDILDARDIYSVIALTSYYNGYYAQTSKAFIRLETLEGATEKDAEVSGSSRFIARTLHAMDRSCVHVSLFYVFGGSGC